MSSRSDSGTGLARGLSCWWRDTRAHYGFLPTLRLLFDAVREFVRESTPQKKKQLYGDVDFDWDYRVNTTSANVDWRTRLLGVLNSPYQPTEPGLFHEMIGSLKLDFREFTFIDIGSGKGRALLMASDYPFQRIVGVELVQELHRAAEENLRRYHSSCQHCFSIETHCTDARAYNFPDGPIVVYFFNPLPEHALAQVVANLAQTRREMPNPAYVIYHNPLLEHVFNGSGRFRKVAGTEQYSLFESVLSTRLTTNVKHAIPVFPRDSGS